MAPIDPSTRDVPDDDELDAILNGTLDGDDVFDTSRYQAQAQSKEKPTKNDAGLGIDEALEISKKKQRQPIPKLDKQRLLSDPGIPRLRRIAKDRLKFKGKGHEYGDVARMLNMYQLWLDDLYPRAKFADGLAMIEKLGHTKEIQVSRKAWIEEGRPKDIEDQSDDDDFAATVLERTREAGHERMEGVELQAARRVEGEEEMPTDQRSKNMPQREKAPENEDPDEDELDALLAEGMEPTTWSTSASKPITATAAAEDPFADDMEAMAEIEDMW